MRDLLKVLLLMLDEIVVLVVLVLVLPLFGIHVPWWLVLVIMAGLLYLTYYTYNSIRNISKRPATGARESLVGRTGKVTTPLHPDGSVRIGAENWKATSGDSEIGVGESIVVVDVKGIVLVVKRVEAAHSTDNAPAA